MKHANTNEKPTLFYKFHEYNDYLFDLLGEGTFWFTNQEDLNDSKDCKFSLSDDLNLKLLRGASDMLKNSLKSLNEDVANIFEDHIDKLPQQKLNDTNFRNMAYNMIFKWAPAYVCCFTECPLNELMWGHYGAGNKGVCLEFSFVEDSYIYEKLMKVRYDNKIPELKSMDERYDAFLRKNLVWDYEKEWRLVSNSGGKFKFNKNSLKSIYFGSRVEVEKIDHVRDFLSGKGYTEVKFKQLGENINGFQYKPSTKIPLETPNQF